MTDNFKSKIDFSGDCWEWTAAVNSKGYGIFSVDGSGRLAHRLSYERWMRPIPEGMQIDHLCHNKLCVRPAHLEPVANEENSRRRWETYTICASGHPLTGDNVRVHRRANGVDTNECVLCARARSKAYRERAKRQRREVA